MQGGNILGTPKTRIMLLRYEQGCALWFCLNLALPAEIFRVNVEMPSEMCVVRAISDILIL